MSGSARSVRPAHLLLVARPRTISTPAALLDGGLAAWTDDLDDVRCTPHQSDAPPLHWPPTAFRSADDVGQANASRSAVVLDARAVDRYSGASVLPSDIRSGRIPRARSAPWARNLTAEGTFVTADELRQRYAAHRITDGTDVIIYCGSGVTACHDLLAIELAGLGRGAPYPGSWSAWSADPARPIAVGDDPSSNDTGVAT